MNQPFEFPVKVYYEDTDAGGVVYYANYLRFMERARSEWLYSLGFEHRKLAEQWEAGFIVRNLEIAYKAPARLDDRLVVKTSPVSVRRVGMLLLQEVTFQESEALAVSAKVDMAFVNAKSLRPEKIPADLLEAIQAWLPTEDTAH
jgi:acyl-CoA thioester hydrolase